MSRPRSRALALALFGVPLVVALAGPVRAQGGAPAAPPDTLLSRTPAPADSTPPPAPAVSAPAPAAAPAVPTASSADTAFAYPALFSPRTRDEILRDVDVQSRVRATAQRLMVDARALQTRRKYDADIKGTEIDAAKKRLDLAKKEKRQADIPTLDAERKRLEAQKDYLEKLRDAAGADADFQQATIDYANARDAAARAEQALLDVGNYSNADVRGSSAARAAQSKWNDALKGRAQAGSALADREKTLCDRRKSAMDSWNKLSVKG